MKGKDIAIAHQNLERKFLKAQQQFYEVKKTMNAAKAELTNFNLEYGGAVKAMKEAAAKPSMVDKLLRK